MKYILLLLLLHPLALIAEPKSKLADEFEKYFGEDEATTVQNDTHIKLLTADNQIRTRNNESFYLAGLGTIALKIELNKKGIEKILVLRKPEPYDKKVYEANHSRYYFDCHVPVKIASFTLNSDKKIPYIYFRIELPCNGMSRLIVWAKTKRGKYYLNKVNLFKNVAHGY